MRSAQRSGARSIKDRRPSRASAAAKAAARLVPAEHLERVEQRRAAGPAHDGHPDRRLGLAELAPDRLPMASVARGARPRPTRRPRRPPGRRSGSAAPPRRPATAFCQLSASSGGSSRKRKSTSSGTSPSTDTRSWTTGASAANAPASKRSGGHGGASVTGAPLSGSRQPPGAHSPGTGSTQGRAAATKRPRQLADVDAVHVGQLLHVEEGRRALHVLEAEALDELSPARSPRRPGSSPAGPGSCGRPSGR